jgi:hypothetical protein
MDFLRRPAVALVATALFGIGLASFAVMLGLQRVLGGATVKSDRRG